MPTFLWSGKDANGQQRSERVEAENAQVAKGILAGRGWTGLELVKDEAAHGASLQFERNPPDWVVNQGDEELEEDWKKEFEKQNTPDQEVAFFKGQQPSGLRAQTWTAIKESIRIIVIFAALLGFGIYRHKIWLIVLGAAGIGVCVLLMPALHLVFSIFSRSSRDYSRLNKAKVWGRWNEVLKCVERLRQKDRLTGAAVPELELGRCRAQALAALGRLDEALADRKR